MNEVTRVYLAIHGETEGNRSGRFEARLDSPLTDCGLKQAAALAVTLEDVDIHVIYSSPSPRAIHTAETVNVNRNISFLTDDALYELDLGTWDGHTRDEIAQIDKIRYEQFRSHPEEYHPEQGESFKDLQCRVVSFLSRVREKHANQNLLLVSHSGVIKMMIDHVRLKPISQYWEKPNIPGSLTCIRFGQEKAVVELEADIRHLPCP